MTFTTRELDIIVGALDRSISFWQPRVRLELLTEIDALALRFGRELRFRRIAGEPSTEQLEEVMAGISKALEGVPCSGHLTEAARGAWSAVIEIVKRGGAR